MNEANEQLDRFEAVKLATRYWHGDEQTSMVVIILFIVAFIGLFAGAFFLQRHLREKTAKAFFVKYAKNKNLTDKEIEILWKYARKMERDPMLVLEFKAPFEKVMDLYIKTDPNADEKLVQEIRKKLDFVVHSPYIPLITTKDIELFQNGRMIFSDNKAVNVALYDKDERYMYWLVVENDLPRNVAPGEEVKVVFVRNDDGIYTISLPIAEIIEEDGKTLIKLPHTFELHRTQRREFPRIRLDEAATVEFKPPGSPQPLRIEGRLRDISAGGGRVCFDRPMDELRKLKYGDIVTLQTTLNDHTFTLRLKILEKDLHAKESCIRGIFVDIDDETKEKIMEFVQHELLKIAQLKRRS